MTPGQGDLFSGHEARRRGEDGMARAVFYEGPTFTYSVMDVVRAYGDGAHLTGEDIRLACEHRGINARNPNAWGGTIAGLVREGLLTPSGLYRKMRDPKSHGRETKIYIVTAP